MTQAAASSLVVSRLMESLTISEKTNVENVLSNYGSAAAVDIFWGLINDKYKQRYEEIVEQTLVELKEIEEFVASKTALVPRNELITVTRKPKVDHRFERKMAEVSRPLLSSLLVVRTLRELQDTFDETQLKQIDFELGQVSGLDQLRLLKEIYEEKTGRKWGQMLLSVKQEVVAGVGNAMELALDDYRQQAGIVSSHA